MSRFRFSARLALGVLLASFAANSAIAHDDHCATIANSVADAGFDD